MPYGVGYRRCVLTRFAWLFLFGATLGGCETKDDDGDTSDVFGPDADVTAMDDDPADDDPADDDPADDDPADDDPADDDPADDDPADDDPADDPADDDPIGDDTGGPDDTATGDDPVVDDDPTDDTGTSADTSGTDDGSDSTGGTEDGAATTGGTEDSTATTGGTEDSAATTGGTEDSAATTGGTEDSAATTGGTEDSAATTGGTDDSAATTGGTEDGSGTTGGSSTDFSELWISDDLTVAAGDTITVPVNLYNTESYMGWQFDVHWDPVWFTVLSSAEGEHFSDWDGEISDAWFAEEGRIRALSVSMTGSVVEPRTGSVLLLELAVASETPAGAYELTLDTATIATASAESIPLMTNNGTLTVTEAVAPPPPPLPCAMLDFETCASDPRCETLSASVLDEEGCADETVAPEVVACTEALGPCGDAMTWAESPSGECRLFSSTCIPDGWTSCSGCSSWE